MPRSSRNLVAVAALIVWLPMFAPLAMDDWFQLDAYREEWLRSVWFKPGWLLAQVSVASWEDIDVASLRWIALAFAIALCALLAWSMHRAPRRRWRIAAGAAALSFVHAFALCWAATHG